MAAEDHGLDQSRDTNRILAIVFLAILALVYFLAALRTNDETGAPNSLASVDPSGLAYDEAAFSGVDTLKPPTEPPLPPVQWNAEGSRVPFAQWWSSLISDGAPEIVWANPLAVLINSDGLIAVDSPQTVGPPVWDSAAKFEPALFIDAGADSQSTEVVEYGDFHVKALVSDSSGSRVEVTLVQGNPYLELKSDPNLSIHVPGLELDQVGESSATFGGLGGEWILVASSPVNVVADGDVIRLSSDAEFGLVLAPAFGDTDEIISLGADIVASPVSDTIERLRVSDDGTVTQELEVSRPDNTDSVLVVLPHQQDKLVSPGARQVGEVPGVFGTYPAIAGTKLTVEYQSVSTVWGFVANDSDVASSSAPDELPAPAGSYFGGKEVLRLAQLAQLAIDRGDHGVGQDYLDKVEVILADLVTPGESTSLSWDANWSSVIIEPAEFGSSLELNDHSLQYGYWVSAASIYVQHRPDSIDGLAGAVELLIGDYGGRLDGADGSTQHSTLSTWSAYEGHSWTSGTVPFSSGNNLESTSESSHAWWAAARWYVVSGQPELAEPFLARFTIETSVATHRWLPHDVSEGDRPWSGVVWSASVDEMTWFDNRPEAALGIKLLPLTPASLARYSSSRDREAAEARWDWCDANGGCGDLWPNLLDSDAVVAGRPLLQGDGRDELSTSGEVLSWWRDMWDSGYTPSDDWACGAGAVAMTASDGSTFYVGSNPGPDDLTVTCESANDQLVLTIGSGEKLGQ